MNNRYLLSIVVPTKNRQKYAFAIVKQVIRMNDFRVQIVIQDNSDTGILKEMISLYKSDERIKYNYTEGTMSFVDNFSLAISLAEGEYICIIGDDDGVMPQIVAVTEWAKKNNIDAIKPELKAVYFWPNSESQRNKLDNGSLSIGKITAEARLGTPSKEVEKLLDHGGQKYLSLDMVKLYHGIVKKSCLENIKKKTGRYIGGLSPDIYIAVALSLIIDKVVEIDFPLTISGVCNQSGSAASATGRHTGRLEEAPHFLGQNNYKWSELVPKFYSVETIWADSTLAALNDLKIDDYIKKFNIAALTAYCIKKYPQFKNIILAHYNEKVKTVTGGRLELNKAYIKYPIADLFKRVVGRIKRKKSDIIRINEVEDIIKAGDILQKRISDSNLSTNTILASLEKALMMRK